MKYPVIERKYMRGSLTIEVWYEKPSMKCMVRCGLSSIALPRFIDELWEWVRGIADLEEAKRIYKIISIEVNDMLREYYSKHNQSGNIIGEDGMMAEQFHFLVPPRDDTVLSVQNGQVHIMSGATPMELAWNAPSREELLRVERYEPRAEYLSDEEYEEKKRNGELRSGCVYCVLN